VAKSTLIAWGFNCSLVSVWTLAILHTYRSWPVNKISIYLFGIMEQK